MKLFIRLLISSIAVFIAAYLLPGVSVSSFWVAVIVAIVLGIINVFVRPLLVILTLPITVVTLGLFILVINAALILLASAIVPDFAVAGFWWALLFSLVVSVVSGFLNLAAGE